MRSVPSGVPRPPALPALWWGWGGVGLTEGVPPSLLAVACQEIAFVLHCVIV